MTGFDEANLLRLECGAARVQVRPSGTEPKVKIYGEGVDEDPTPFVDAVAAAAPVADRVARYQSPNWRSPASPRPGTM